MNRAEILEQLAERGPNGVPVLGASAAAAHTKRGYGYMCPEELETVWDALDGLTDWDRAGRVANGPTYIRLVSALTGYQIACDRALGLR